MIARLRLASLYRAALCLSLLAVSCSDDPKQPGKTSRECDSCRPEQSCVDGACRDPICTPDTKFCEAGAVRQCDSRGAVSEVVATCGPDQYCSASDDDAECQLQVCSPGAPLCDGDTATACAADGSGPEPGGEDCAQADQQCYAGKCRSQVCTAGEMLCQDGDVYACTASGTDVALFADCEADEVCDPESGSCRARNCDSGELACNGTKVVSCNRYGSAWEDTGTDCAASGQPCVQGACQAVGCKPFGTFCQGNSLYRCDALGVLATLREVCAVHCHDYPEINAADCREDRCTPGESRCDGWLNVITCNADGTPPPTSTPCASDQYCDDGVCVARGCDYQSYSCLDGDAHYCNLGGSEITEHCAPEQPCAAYANVTKCLPHACVAGATVCFENQIGVCSDDGSALGSVTKDCAGQGQICDADGACADQVGEELVVQAPETVGTMGRLVGNVLDIRSTRRLTGFAINPGPVDDRSLRKYLIYEARAGVFVLVLSGFSVAGADSFFYSDQLGLTLEAGKHYYLGLFGEPFEGTEAVRVPAFSKAFSFAQVLGTQTRLGDSDFPDDFDASRVYRMRIATEAP